MHLYLKRETIPSKFTVTKIYGYDVIRIYGCEFTALPNDKWFKGSAKARTALAPVLRHNNIIHYVQ